MQPHRRDVWPIVNALVLSPASARAPRPETLRRYVRGRGGELWSLATRGAAHATVRDPLPEQGAIGFAEALLASAAQMRESHVVDLLVPNPDQDGARHDLSIRIREAEAKANGSSRVELQYMPDYFSSPPLAEKLWVYAASRYKLLRLLAAYEFREHAFDDEFHARLLERRAAEQDAQVEGVLFESWISVQLQRLQAGPREVEDAATRRAYAEAARHDLAQLTGEGCPDPDLASRAARAARGYEHRP